MGLMAAPSYLSAVHFCCHRIQPLSFFTLLCYRATNWSIVIYVVTRDRFKGDKIL